jgi:ApbE family protein
VTIVAPTGMTADALATAVSVMGGADGMRLVETTSGAGAFVAEETDSGVRTFESRRWRALGAFTTRTISDPVASSDPVAWSDQGASAFRRKEKGNLHAP